VKVARDKRFLNHCGKSWCHQAFAFLAFGGFRHDADIMADQRESPTCLWRHAANILR